MWSRIRRVAHPLLTLVLATCCGYLLWRDSHRPGFGRLSPPAQPDAGRLPADWAVRNFLNATWLGGDYELPPGEEHCVAMLFRFEDGQFKGCHRSITFSPAPGGSRVVPFYVMWGPGPNGPRAVSGWPGMWGGSNGDPFYADLGASLGRSYGDAALGELRGYRVVGWAASKELIAGREEAKPGLDGAALHVERNRRVLALVVKPFATREEADAWRDRGEPIGW